MECSLSKNSNFIFCGGGSGGHVLPALTLFHYLKKECPDARFISIGSKSGIEKEIFTKNSLEYYSISTGKLRRYFSWQNFLDILRIIKGTVQSFFLLLKWKRAHSVVIATGGFVTVPVVFAAWLQRKKIIVHEQTTRVGLANKICSYFADMVLVTFEDSLKYFPQNKVKHLGYPLREEIFTPIAEETKIKDFTLKDIERPVLFLTGGGNGSKLLNDILDQIRPQIENEFFIVHQCGKAYESEYQSRETPFYKVYGFIGKEMIDLMKTAEVIISRSGAGTVVELMSLGKASIFIPLKIAQKNEQYHNAISAHQILGSKVIEEDELSAESLLEAIEEVRKIGKKSWVKNNPTHVIGNLIKDF
ncbi:MAG: UDP-N-acetylglucosamine--N-acetylmuramyl-(pentapeptide) pyrophosphoryl-undecaprenol N-acetylglucosamine transferase [Halobacteriovoraceae bacterium]|nr:UDP-N-acetylglucosamine--N-acetylmuramyl-(pentapeptide) pyrophosphoryl-undecaprenol N-acetylglucosamine transferase [Halobacteriovoraceae bacterium]